MLGDLPSPTPGSWLPAMPRSPQPEGAVGRRPPKASLGSCGVHGRTLTLLWGADGLKTSGVSPGTGASTAGSRTQGLRQHALSTALQGFHGE